MGSEVRTQPVAYHRDLPHARDAPEFLDLSRLQELYLCKNGGIGDDSFGFEMNGTTKRRQLAINKNAMYFAVVFGNFKQATVRFYDKVGLLF